MADLIIKQAVAIDSAGTRDRDDAIWVRREGGAFEITVAVAQVATLVAPDSAADVAARAAGQTIYRAENVVKPMLPATLQRRLTLGARRNMPVLALSAVLLPDMSISSQVGAARLQQTIIYSYDQIEEVIAGGDAPARDMLREAVRLAEILLNRRRLRGALAVYDPVSGIASTEEGELVRLGEGQRGIGHLIVQELMILANEQIALWAAQRRLPILYRNQHASAVAPPRERIMADLDAAAQHPERFDLLTLERRRQLVIESASYAPYAAGHYALNLPCYTHATSPLRRYADLRTQHVLLAALRGEALPSVEETAAIGEQLTEAARQRSTERSEWFKTQAHERSLQLSAAVELSRLSADEFHEALKVRLRTEQMTATMNAEVARRAAADLLQPRDAYVAMFTPGAPEGLRAEIATWLEAHPEHAASVLAMLAQSEQLAAVEFAERAAGTKQQPAFGVQASLTRGETVGGAWRVAPTKRAARAQAALSLLSALAGLADRSVDIAPSSPIHAPEQQPDLPAQDEAAISALHNWTQARRMEKPEFSYSSSGSSHAPQFVATVTLTTERGVFQASGSGGSKAAAREQAAAALIAALYADQVDIKPDG